MRKILAVMVALMLALTAVGALAEAAAGVNVTTHNFGDFNLSYPEDCRLDLGTKTDNGVYFTLFSPSTSEANFSNNLNCVWMSQYEDITQYQPQDLLDYTVSSFAEGAAAQGLIVTNVQGLKADWVQMDGLQAMAIGYSYDADYSNMGANLQASLICMSVSVADPSFGVYTFSITSGNEVGIQELANVLDSITWN